ncbi:MAG: YifB family Mg chelatase-like AAA ATPase [Pseudomonadales bacterium]
MGVAGAAAAGQGNRAYGRALVGMDSPRVTVETHLPGGLPGFTLVGLPETAVREARDRVKSAIQNCGFDFPRGKVVVNLAPAELAKEGARFDLAIAISVLRATGQIPPRADRRYEFLGELGLFGELRATRGCLCAALAIQREADNTGTRLIIPAVNAVETCSGPENLLLTASHLSDVVAFLRNPSEHPLGTPAPSTATAVPGAAPEPHLDDVLGQHGAKRALLIAAAGGHHLLMVGPPGTGKTMLARRLPTLLPELEDGPAMEVAAVYSAAGLPAPAARRAPIRAPHHSASAPAMVGGGRQALPGEISLAHRGVLFLDELPHFKPSVLDLLREPLESREISLARAGYRSTFPAHFQLVAAMNPCPAGRHCSEHSCRCSPDQVRRYQGRISGPLLDRIDLHVAVPPVPRHLVLGTTGRAASEVAADARPRVAAARAVQSRRQRCLNADLTGTAVLDAAHLDAAGRRLLERATDRYVLSARGAHRVLRTARTIADLDGADAVGTAHLSEALSFRALDWDGGLGMAAH